MAAHRPSTLLRSPERRMLLAGPLVAAVSMLSALLLTHAAGVPLRDPDHVAGRRLLIVFGFVLALVAVDVFVRARRHSAGVLPTWAALHGVMRQRWTRSRAIAVASALISFYVSYLAYRNLKSVVPLLRPGESFDRELAEIDRSLFGGNDPAYLMHTLFGTGFATELFSAVYMLFFLFIPGTLALALVFSRDLQAGLFYATALSLNWLVGAASYFLLPSLGPIYFDPAAFSQLTGTGVLRLQEILLDQRLEYLSDPLAGSAQSIAAFSSLHVSIFFTGAVAAHLLGLGRRVKIVAWVLLVLTTGATIHLGWHYVLDDVGGVVVGVMALALARVLTGFELGVTRRITAPRPTPA